MTISKVSDPTKTGTRVPTATEFPLGTLSLAVLTIEAPWMFGDATMGNVPGWCLVPGTSRDDKMIPAT